MIKQLLKSKDEFDKRFHYLNDLIKSKVLIKINKEDVWVKPQEEIKAFIEEQQLALIQEIKDWAEENRFNDADRLSPRYVIDVEDLLKELDSIKEK